MKNRLNFCYTKNLFPKGKTARAIGLKGNYWEKGSTIKIAFYNGTSSQIEDMIEDIEYMFSFTSLKADFIDDLNDSDIRISFIEGIGSWSFLGVQSKFIPKDEPTLNIGWESRATRLHELGHLLNLRHEHMRGIEWNREKVIEDLSGPPNNWTIEEIEHNVLNEIDLSKHDHTDFDEDSIMLYPFPESWTLNNVKTKYNQELSAKDKEFLQRQYGITEGDKIAPVITILGEQYQTIEYGSDYIDLGATALDNRDGDISEDILVDGYVDTLVEGPHYISYSVSDKAGNKSEKIRTVVVKEQDNKGCLLGFLGRLFPSKSRLGKLLESQVVTIANELGIDATKDDLKSETVSKVWKIIG